VIESVHFMKGNNDSMNAMLADRRTHDMSPELWDDRSTPRTLQ
jgi:hypothetical protein